MGLNIKNEETCKLAGKLAQHGDLLYDVYGLPK